jgi:hypothetical protein
MYREAEGGGTTTAKLIPPPFFFPFLGLAGPLMTSPRGPRGGRPRCSRTRRCLGEWVDWASVRFE